MALIPRVTILGAGLAGLAAAACLAESGFEVELIEKRTVLGGRASSFSPPGETERIDNCQHVLLGCCTNLLDFFRRTGTAGEFRFFNSYLFLGPGGASRMGASLLPAPLHLFPALIRFKDLGWPDRWAVAKAMNVILQQGGALASELADEPMIDWLRRQRQTSPAIENFWRVVLTSALNEDLERLSTRHAFKVFYDGFLKNRRGYRMGVPAIPLSDLYSTKHLSERCRLRLGSNASLLEIVEHEIQSVRLREGESSTSDYYISTLPPDALSHLLPGEPGGLWPELEKLANLEWSPITGIHLWFDRPITTLEHAAIVGRTIQWMFNRSAIGMRSEPRPEGSGSVDKAQYIQLVISASRSLMNMKRDELLELALRELRALFPKAGEATLLKSVVVKESKATLSPFPGIDALRLGPRTPFRSLFVAGDWTSTGWPFTMEGAVRSGYRAAELVTEASGEPKQFLQPDLPADALVRLASRSKSKRIPK